MTLPKQFISLLLIYCFALSAAAGASAPTTVSTENSSTTIASTIFSEGYCYLSSFWSPLINQSEDENADEETGLRFRLSEAPEQPEARPVSKVAATTPLSDAETESILKRLPPIKTDPADETTFALRDKSLPPPRTGVTLLQPFPAANALARPEQKTGGKLEVVRYSPEGEVPIAPNLSITFSEPMVAVTSQEEAAQNVPVKLSPEPPGKWHWIGTRTLLFEPDARFPMATQYSVTVPAGTKSANGATLGQTKSWIFTTPAPTVKNFYPAKLTVQRRDVLMFAEFDQRIDPNVVLKHLSIEAGNHSVRLRLATPEEIEKDKEVRELVKKAQADRWLAFRATAANGKVANPIGTRPDRHLDCDPPSDDLLVKRVHVLDPEEDANTRRRPVALGQMHCRVVPPDYSVLRRLGSRIGPEPQHPPVERGRGRNIRDGEQGRTLIELFRIADGKIWHCALTSGGRRRVLPNGLGLRRASRLTCGRAVDWTSPGGSHTRR